MRKFILIIVSILFVSTVVFVPMQEAVAASALKTRVTLSSTSAMSTNQINLRWKKSGKKPTGYQVYRKQVSGKWKKVATTKKTSFVNKKLTAQTMYFYKIRAYKKYKKNRKTSYQYGKFSNVRSAKTKRGVSKTANQSSSSSSTQTENTDSGLTISIDGGATIKRSYFWSKDKPCYDVYGLMTGSAFSPNTRPKYHLTAYWNGKVATNAKWVSDEEKDGCDYEGEYSIDSNGELEIICPLSAGLNGTGNRDVCSKFLYVTVNGITATLDLHAECNHLYEYKQVRKALEDKLWTPNMTTEEKIQAVANYTQGLVYDTYGFSKEVSSRYLYGYEGFSKADACCYSYRHIQLILGHRSGNCTNGANVVIDCAEDLGLDAGYARTMPENPNHTDAGVKINGETKTFYAAPSGAAISDQTFPKLNEVRNTFGLADFVNTVYQYTGNIVEFTWEKGERVEKIIGRWK